MIEPQTDRFQGMYGTITNFTSSNITNSVQGAFEVVKLKTFIHKYLKLLKRVSPTNGFIDSMKQKQHVM